VRDPTARPIVIFITDGKSNVALGERKPLEESLELASLLAGDKRIRFIVIDTESQGMVNFGLARNLAVSMNARYFKIEDLKADTLLNVVKENVK
jgi:magnesium chelatase subunit D